MPNINSQSRTQPRKNGAKKMADDFSMQPGINLMQQDKGEAVRSTQRTVVGHLLGSVFISLGLVAAVYGGLFIYGYMKEQELASLRQELSSLDQSIGTIEAHRAELAVFQNTLQKVKELLANHIRWTRFFALLEQHTLPDVTYVNVVVSPQGKIRLSGIAKDYTTLARQLKAFEDAADVFTQVSIPSGHAILSQTGTTVGVSFDASMTLKPAILTSVTQ